MTVHQYIRLISGVFMLASLALAYLVDMRWLWLAAFVGLNLLQSAFSDWCPMTAFLRKMGVPECRHDSAPAKARAARG